MHPTDSPSWRSWSPVGPAHVPVKLVDHLGAYGPSHPYRAPSAVFPQATELAQSLNDGQPMPPIDGGSPQLCTERGLTLLAQRRGEARPEMVENLAVLGLATFPFPPRCFVSSTSTRTTGWSKACSESKVTALSLADNWLRQRAQGLISNRMTVEDALADALTRANVGEGRWENIARHRIQGRDPNRALPYAIRAAVQATEESRFTDARAWLMAIDPLKRDRDDPTYKALRFDLAWARAVTSLRTELSRVRDDLVAQARVRATTIDDKHRCDIIEVELATRQGRHDDAVALLERTVRAGRPPPYPLGERSRPRASGWTKAYPARPESTSRERSPSVPTPIARWSVSISLCWRAVRIRRWRAADKRSLAGS